MHCPVVTQVVTLGPAVGVQESGALIVVIESGGAALPAVPGPPRRSWWPRCGPVWAGSAHAVIREHAVAVAMLEKGAGKRFARPTGRDGRLPLDRADLDVLLADRLPFTGAAAAQVAALLAQVETVLARYPEAAAYRPASIL